MERTVSFNVLDTKEIAQAMTDTTQLLTMLLGAVAAVSLLVGGIGILPARRAAHPDPIDALRHE